MIICVVTLWLVNMVHHCIRFLSTRNTKRRNVSSLWLLLMMTMPLFVVLITGIVYWNVLPVLQNFPTATTSILLRSSSSFSSGGNYSSTNNTIDKNTTTTNSNNNKENNTRSRLNYSTATQTKTKSIMTTHTPTTQPTVRTGTTTYNNPPISTIPPTTTAIREEAPPFFLAHPYFRLENIDFDSSPPPCGAHKCLYRANKKLGLPRRQDNNNTDGKVETPISIGFLVAQSDDKEDMVGSWEASEYIISQYPGRKHFFLDGGIGGDGTGKSASRPIEYHDISKEFVDQLNRGRVPTKSRTKFTTKTAIMVQTVQLAPQSSMLLGLQGKKLQSMIQHIGPFIDTYVVLPTATTTTRTTNNTTTTTPNNNTTLSLFLSTLHDELLATLRIMEEQPWYVNDWQAIMDHHGQFYEIDVAPRIITKDKEEGNTRTNNTIRSSLEVISLKKKKKKKIESTIRYDRCCEVFQDFYHRAMVHIHRITNRNRNRNMIANNINNNNDTTTSTTDSEAAAIVVVEKDDTSYKQKRAFCSKSSQTLFSWINDFDIEAFDRNKDCSHNICTFASLQDDHAAYNVSSPRSSSVNYSVGTDVDVDVDKKTSSEQKIRNHSKYNNADNNILIRNWELAWYISGKYNIHHLVLGRPEYIQIPAVVTTMMTMMTTMVNNNTNNATNINTHTTTTTIATPDSNSHIFSNVTSVFEFFDGTPVYPDKKGTVLVQRVLRQPRSNSVHLFSCTNESFITKDQSKFIDDLKSFVIHNFDDDDDDDDDDEHHQMMKTKKQKKKQKKKEFFERLKRGASQLAKLMVDPKIKFSQYFRVYITNDGSITLLDLYTMTDNSFNNSNNNKKNINNHNHNNSMSHKCVKLLQHLRDEL